MHYDICQGISSSPRKLSYGTYYPWGHANRTVVIAQRAGCHLCNFVWHNASYNLRTHDPRYSDEFPNRCTYAFKALNPEWAQHGKGPKWLVPASGGDGDDFLEVGRYMLEIENDLTKNQLYSLLAADSEEIFNISTDFWLVLDFYCPGPRIVLPLDVIRDEIEDIAQVNFETQNYTGSKETLQLATSWLNNCIKNHPECRPAFEDENWLPTRLIYVGSLSTPEQFIIATSSLRNKLFYAALSHRWGSTKDYTLTSKLLSRYRTKISLSNVSRTMKDALHTTRSQA